MTELLEKKISEMYNPKYKAEYLEQFKNNSKNFEKKVYLMTTYSKTFEIPYNRNLFEIKIGEFQLILPKLEHILLFDYRKDISYLSHYIKWAEDKGYNKSSSVSLIDGIELKALDMKETIRKRILKDGEQLISYLKRAGYLITTHNISNSVIIFLLVWLGVQPSEIIQLKDNDVNINDGTIRFGQREINIPENFIDIFDSYKNTDYFIARETGRGYNAYKNTSPYFIKYLIKGTNDHYNEPYTLTALRKILFNTYATNSDDDFVYTAVEIQYSGEFYRYYKMKEENPTWEFEVALKTENPKWNQTQISDYICTHEQYCEYYWK